MFSSNFQGPSAINQTLIRRTLKLKVRYDHTCVFSSTSSSGIPNSELGTTGKSCVNLEAIFADFSSRLTDSAALWAGDEACSPLRVEGVDGDDFWKNPRIDFWFFMFWVLGFDRFSGVAAGGDEASGPLAILRRRCTISTAKSIIKSCHELSSNSRASKKLQGKMSIEVVRGMGMN
jgi:hypothetical protein